MDATALWNIALTGTASVSYVDFAYCNASGGTTYNKINAKNNCNNKGNNLGIIFVDTLQPSLMGF